MTILKLINELNRYGINATSVDLSRAVMPLVRGEKFCFTSPCNQFCIYKLLQTTGYHLEVSKL